MGSVEEVRAGIALANEKANESMGALREAATALEQAQSMLAEATQGSSQSDAEQAQSLLAHAVQSIGEIQSSVDQAIHTAEGYAARL
jgi:replicative DNA helicase